MRAVQGNEPTYLTEVSFVCVRKFILAHNLLPRKPYPTGPTSS